MLVQAFSMFSPVFALVKKKPFTGGAVVLGFSKWARFASEIFCSISLCYTNEVMVLNVHGNEQQRASTYHINNSIVFKVAFVTQKNDGNRMPVRQQNFGVNFFLPLGINTIEIINTTTMQILPLLPGTLIHRTLCWSSQTLTMLQEHPNITKSMRTSRQTYFLPL
jgi:hypothetical protein